jgi:hypothetical protein
MRHLLLCLYVYVTYLHFEDLITLIELEIVFISALLNIRHTGKYF